jgi:hypothetical protein
MRKAIRQMMQEHHSTPWIGTQEAIQRLRAGGMKMSLPTLIKLLRKGEIVGKQLGVRWFVSVDDIENLLRVKST